MGSYSQKNLTLATGWRRLIGSPKVQIIVHKRAMEYRSLLRKRTYKDKGSYESSPPCRLYTQKSPLCSRVMSKKVHSIGVVWSLEQRADWEKESQSELIQSIQQRAEVRFIVGFYSHKRALFSSKESPFARGKPARTRQHVARKAGHASHLRPPWLQGAAYGTRHDTRLTPSHVYHPGDNHF